MKSIQLTLRQVLTIYNHLSDTYYYTIYKITCFSNYNPLPTYENEKKFQINCFLTNSQIINIYFLVKSVILAIQYNIYSFVINYFLI